MKGLLLLLLAVTAATNALNHNKSNDGFLPYAKPLTSEEKAAARALPPITSLYSDEPPLMCSRNAETTWTPEGRNFMATTSRKWPHNTIPYTIHSIDILGLWPRIVIGQAIESITSRTKCIKFVPRFQKGDAHVLIKTPFHSGGCHSGVGYRRGKTTHVNLEFPRCATDFNMVVHELMHVIGGYHEHARADRDFYIHIAWENIAKGREYDFTKITSEATSELHNRCKISGDKSARYDHCYSGERVTEFGLYDFASQLHYMPLWTTNTGATIVISPVCASPPEASANGKPSFIPLIKADEIRTDNGLSYWDIEKIKHTICEKRLVKQQNSKVQLGRHSCLFHIITGHGGRIDGSQCSSWHGNIWVDYGYVIDIFIAFPRRDHGQHCKVHIIDPYETKKSRCRTASFSLRSRGNRLLLEAKLPFVIVWQRVRETCCKEVTLKHGFPGLDGLYRRMDDGSYRKVSGTGSGSKGTFVLWRDNSSTVWWLTRSHGPHVDAYRLNGYVLCPEHLVSVLHNYKVRHVDMKCVAGCVHGQEPRREVRQGIVMQTTKSIKWKNRFLFGRVCQPEGTWTKLMKVFCPELDTGACATGRRLPAPGFEGDSRDRRINSAIVVP